MIRLVFLKDHMGMVLSIDWVGCMLVASEGKAEARKPDGSYYRKPGKIR